MIVIVTLISTTFLFVIALATRFRRKRPFTAETVIQDGLASFGVGIAFGLVAYPTLSVVTAFVGNGSALAKRQGGAQLLQLRFRLLRPLVGHPARALFVRSALVGHPARALLVRGASLRRQARALFVRGASLRRQARPPFVRSVSLGE